MHTVKKLSARVEQYFLSIIAGLLSICFWISCPIPSTSDDIAGSGGGGKKVPPGSSTPAVEGFSFTIEEGTYWEFAWTYSSTSFSQGSGTTAATETGVFIVTLGGPRLVEGIPMYEVVVTGEYEDGNGNVYAPRWLFIGLRDNRLFGSLDGITADIIMDAKTGSWHGGGFFTAFSGEQNNKLAPYTLTNEYVGSTETVAVSRSTSSGQGVYIGGVYVPPSDTQTEASVSECYKPGIGPIGYAEYHSAAYSGGGYYTSFTHKKELGLVDTNLSSYDGFTPMRPSWKKVAPMQYARANFAAGALDGKIYVTGGGSKTLEIYNQDSDDWIEGPPPPYDISSGAMIDGKFYCMAKFEDQGTAKDMLYVYDPALDTWTSLWDLGNLGLFQERMIAAKGSLYILNGTGSPFNLVWRYTPRNGSVPHSWTVLSQADASPILRPGAATDGLNIYAIGGYIAGQFQARMKSMDLGTGTWHFQPGMNVARSDCGAAYMNGSIYVAGGYHSGGRTRSFERFSIQADAWETLAAMPTARECASVVAAGGRIYVLGGYAGAENGNVKIVEMYDPALERQ